MTLSLGSLQYLIRVGSGLPKRTRVLYQLPLSTDNAETEADHGRKILLWRTISRTLNGLLKSHFYPGHGHIKILGAGEEMTSQVIDPEPEKHRRADLKWGHPTHYPVDHEYTLCCFHPKIQAERGLAAAPGPAHCHAAVVPWDCPFPHPCCSRAPNIS